MTGYGLDKHGHAHPTMRRTHRKRPLAMVLADSFYSLCQRHGVEDMGAASPPPKMLSQQRRMSICTPNPLERGHRRLLPRLFAADVGLSGLQIRTVRGL